MASFTDKSGKAWRLDLTVATIKRVRSLTDVDLLDDNYGEVLVDLGRDVIKLVDVLFAIVQPQATEADITDEQFGEALFGDAIDKATEAFIDSVIEFFPSEKKRQALRVMWSNVRSAINEGEAELLKVVESEEMTRANEATVEKMKAELWTVVGSMSGGKSTSSPAS